MFVDDRLAALNVCLLETVGRVSGQPRLVELWFAAAAAGDRVYFLSGGRDGSAWVRNIAAEPAVRLRLGDRWFRGRAAWIEGAPDDPIAREALDAKYHGWQEGRPLTRWARTALPVRLDLEGEDRAR
jgi:deazaflavin-dependent oxidoreductase (nitroreductase family)